MDDPAADSTQTPVAALSSPGSGGAPVAHPDPAGAPEPNLALFLQAARDPAVDVAKLKELMALRKEVQEDAARRAFYAALAAAKGEFEPILKKRQVDYEHRNAAGRTSYKYEELADIAHVVDPVLSRHGLSYRHRSTQDGDKIRCTCILSHADGYSEENSLEGYSDKSGQKNPIQANQSTVTYLQRGTLKQALGLAAGRDDDGRAAYDQDATPMSADEIAYIEQLIRDTESDLTKFLGAIGAPSIADMNDEQYKRAAALLNEKKRRAGGTAQR